MALTTESVRNSMRPSSGTSAQGKLNLLEIYCEKDSQLVRVANMYGLPARRFTLSNGHLSTPEGQERLWKIMDEQQPDHIWGSPECRYWGNFSRWNRSKSSDTAHKIDEGRKQERKNLSLCEEMYGHQVSNDRHFHLEQPKGSEALVQKQIDGVIQRLCLSCARLEDSRYPKEIIISGKERLCSRHPKFVMPRLTPATVQSNMSTVK